MLTDSALSALVFVVRDLDATARFYTDVLGLALARERGHDGAFLHGMAGEVSLVFVPGEEGPGPSPIAVFGLDGGIDDTVDALVAAGVEIVTPVSEAPDGGWTADFADPDGHVLSLYQAADAPRRATS